MQATEMVDDFPFANSRAARMLQDGLSRAKKDKGLSVRQIGVHLGYRQQVSVGHMASGRSPIPIDRAEDIAAAVDLDPAEFLEAVVWQRYPNVDWSLMKVSTARQNKMTVEEALEAVFIADPTITRAQRKVVKELVIKRSSAARWLSTGEFEVMEIIRSMRPNLETKKISDVDRKAIESALK